MMRVNAVYAWILCAAAAAATARGQLAAGFRLAADPLPAVVPVGCSVPLRLTLTNAASEPLPLKMSVVGTPEAAVRVVDEAGEQPRIGPPYYERGRAQTPDDEVYRVPPGEAVELRYNLGELLVFDPARPQRYAVELRTAAGVQGRLAFRTVAHRPVGTRQVQGTYQPPAIGELTNAIRLAARVSVVESVEAVEAADRRRWLVVDQLAVRDEQRRPLPGYCVPVDPAADVDRAELDFLGQLWVVVRAGDASSLLLWRLHEPGWSVLVPPTRERVEVGVTRARMFIPDQNVVVAGVAGKPKMTTHSVWRR